MKYSIFTLIFIAVATFSYAKTSPEGWLAKIPAAPKSCCGVGDAEKSSYQKSVSDLEKDMEKEIRERKKELDAYVEANRERMASRMITRPGGMDAKPRKKGKMTKEEKKAMAEKMMREYGMEPGDPEKLKSMSKEERAAWGRKYAEGMDKKMESDQQYQNAKSQSKQSSEAIAEQQALNQKLTARVAGIVKKFGDLDRKAEALENKELDPIRKKIAAYGEIISKEQEAPLRQDLKRLEDARKRYCEALAPQYRALLDEYLSAIRASLSDYRRMDELTAIIQLGLDKPVEAGDGYYGITALEKYLPYLEDVFKFDLKN